MKYFNLILTNHAISRISERGLSKELAWETFNKPDSTYKTNKGSWAFTKNYDNFKTTLIGKKNDRNEWIVVSFWRDPPLPDTKDARNQENWRKSQKAGFWGKIWYGIRQQLGF